MVEWAEPQQQQQMVAAVMVVEEVVEVGKSWKVQDEEAVAAARVESLPWAIVEVGEVSRRDPTIASWVAVAVEEVEALRQERNFQMVAHYPWSASLPMSIHEVVLLFLTVVRVALDEAEEVEVAAVVEEGEAPNSSSTFLRVIKQLDTQLSQCLQSVQYNNQSVLCALVSQNKNAACAVPRHGRDP